MKRFLLALFLFPVAVCTDTNGIVFPYKITTNALSYTNAFTNVHRFSQVDHHFRMTNRFDGLLILERAPGEPWRVMGRSTMSCTNLIIGTQSQREFQIILMTRPDSAKAVRVVN